MIDFDYAEYTYRYNKLVHTQEYNQYMIEYDKIMDDYENSKPEIVYYSDVDNLTSPPDGINHQEDAMIRLIDHTKHLTGPEV
jgi:hypothetical protein